MGRSAAPSRAGFRGGDGLTERQHEDGWHLCTYCGKALHPNVFRHASKRCSGYSWLWGMDVYVIFGENVHEHGGRAALFTVTAPGEEFLPWDTEQCAEQGEHRHSGKLGCRVDPKAAAVWNESAQKRWTAAQREAKRRADKTLREFGWKGRPVSVLLSWWEPQKRGVLHKHALLPWETPAERLWSRAYIRSWEEIRQRFWFGFVDRKPKVDTAQKLARYVAGYTLGGGGKLSLAEAAERCDWLPTRTFHINRRLTQKTGATMRAARFNRRVEACFQGKCHWPVRSMDEWERALRFRLRGIFREHPGVGARVLMFELAGIPEEARAP